MTTDGTSLAPRLATLAEVRSSPACLFPALRPFPDVRAQTDSSRKEPMMELGLHTFAVVAPPYVGNSGAGEAGAQDLFGLSSSARFTRSTAGGITSPMPVHTRSATASS